jgi:tetrahydromethanopterin:alpha-L-glutamate ligase
LCAVDGLVIKKAGTSYSPDMLDRLEILRFVEASGVRIFSHPLSIIRLLDRLSCTITLRAAGIPLPPTIITENVEVATAAIRRFGGAVLKPLYSTKARGMLVVDPAETEDLVGTVRAFQQNGNPIMYVQQKIDVPGRDLGVVFLGGEYVATYARVAAGDAWNTTIHSGGHYEAYEPAPDVIEIARHAQSLFDLDFTSVDVAITDAGPVVFEVSAFGGFRGLEEGLGIDAAELYADYVVRKVSESRA